MGRRAARRRGRSGRTRTRIAVSNWKRLSQRSTRLDSDRRRPPRVGARARSCAFESALDEGRQEAAGRRNRKRLQTIRISSQPPTPCLEIRINQNGSPDCDPHHRHTLLWRTRRRRHRNQRAVRRLFGPRDDRNALISDVSVVPPAAAAGQPGRARSAPSLPPISHAGLRKCQSSEALRRYAARIANFALVASEAA